MRFFLFFSIIFLVFHLGLGAQTQPELALADKYFEEGEYAQSLELYEKLYKQDPSNRHILFRIVSCYDKAREYQLAIKFLDKAIKKETEGFDLKIFKAIQLEKAGEAKESEKVLQTLIQQDLKTIGDFTLASTLFVSLNNFPRAVQAWLQGRKLHKDENLFAEELADVYFKMGRFADATIEYLKLYQFDPSVLTEVKEKILNMVSPSASPEIEKVLLESVQKNQKEAGIRSLVYEFYVLTENFMEAFVQVKSIDKVFAENGERVYQFALTMRSNHNYSLSNKALDYLISNHQDSPFFLAAYKEKTVNGELEAFEKVPLDSLGIRNAVKAYADLLNIFGRNTSFSEAMYRKARLQAFYLFDLAGAMEELQSLISMPVRPKEKAEANLLIGDIYLMQKEFNKAKLKYAEVDLQFKDEQMGALAKLKDGQLSYYKGNFEEAQARLKSIKDNTSNDISNDAIRLNLLIQDNIGMDSVTTALQIFAQAQLLVFQREYEPALVLLDSLAYNFPNHPLQDEILWERANIFLQKGKYDDAILLLQKIIEKFGEDIFGDDALYTLGRIYDYNFLDPIKAMEHYMQLLRDYPGSLFAVSVRKRIRELRKEKL